MSFNPLGLRIAAVGLIIVLLGLLVWSGALNWFGRLPGDIRIERETARIYLPIVSMLLISVVLSLVLYLVRRFF